ncbi:MAG: sugar phosphate isomerase/epimerase [Candidatus Hydrogenedentes bacterium]|nr:sugar phosphate isomerase/epimerase [Candidatus Hydrogenedentota bacterium]
MNTRREFLLKSVIGTFGGLNILPSFSFFQENKSSSPKSDIVIFSKYIQNLKPGELGKICKTCELDGVDLTVREKGHIDPKVVTSDLPITAELIQKDGAKISMITTNLLSAHSPYAEEIIQTASQINIRYIRIGYHKYNLSENINEQKRKFKDEIKSLAELAEKYNVNMGYHNHSGEGNFGGAILDLIEVLEEIQSNLLGINLDLAHLKAEGFGGAWKANLMRCIPWIKMIAVKDFTVEENKIKWVKLNTGCVPIKEMLNIILNSVKFSGPISIHLEYSIASEKEKLDHIRDAGKLLKEIVKA